MSRRTAVSAIVAMMEGIGPTSGMGNQAIGQMDTAGVEVGMAFVSDDQTNQEEAECGFHPDDYLLAKQLVAQVGSVDRARELLENLDEVYETLDLAPADEEQIAFIAGHIPDEPDFPTDSMFGPGQY